MGFQPPLPNSARLIDWGHSWVATPSNPYGGSNVVQDSLPNDGEQWPNALRDALGIGTSGTYTRAYSVPACAATTTTTTYLDIVPGDCSVEAVWYVPSGSVATNATNWRIVTIGKYDSHLGTWAAFGQANTAAGNATANAWTAGVAQGVYNVNSGVGPMNGVATQAIDTPYTPSLGYTLSSTALTPVTLTWTSTFNSSQTDPGGVVIVRYGTRYRNYGVAGACLINSFNTIPLGSSWACFSFHPWSRPNAAEVNVTLAYTTGGTTLTCSPLQYPLAAGQSIVFSNGVVCTPVGATNFGAGAIVVPTSTGNIPAGAQGHYVTSTSGQPGGWESLSPSGINVWTHGFNDAIAATQDVPLWTETVRSVIARCACPAMDYSNQGNFLTSGSTWGTIKPANGNNNCGQLPYAFDNYSTGDSTGAARVIPYLTYSGAGTGSPTCTIEIGPAFEGGTIDLFLLGLGGSSLGVAGTIAASGNPGYSGTFNTSGVSTSGLLTSSPAGTITGSGVTTVTTSSQWSVGTIGTILTTNTGTVPAGTLVTAVGTLTATLSNTVTVSAATPTCHGWVPMVKRITGLPAGSQSITITITGVDSASGPAASLLVVYGIGLESQNPLTPIIWGNIATGPYMSSGQKTNAVALNNASLAVINGTATPPTGNTSEPAFGSNVQYVDLYTLFGGSSPVTSYFLPDGIHPNSKGHRLIARTLFSVIRNNYSPDQLMSR